MIKAVEMDFCCTECTIKAYAYVNEILSTSQKYHTSYINRRLVNSHTYKRVRFRLCNYFKCSPLTREHRLHLPHINVCFFRHILKRSQQ